MSSPTVTVQIGDPLNVCDGCSLVAPGRNYMIVSRRFRICLCAECFETLRGEHAAAFQRGVAEHKRARDLCPRCGEDRSHPSQPKAGHRC